MKRKFISIQSTVFPIGYDKNTSDRRHDPRYAKKFGRNFNKWAKEIREALLPHEDIGNALLDEAKRLITRTV